MLKEGLAGREGCVRIRAGREHNVLCDRKKKSLNRESHRHRTSCVVLMKWKVLQ